MIHRIAALVFPGFELLDLFGPMQMFGLLPDRYSIHIVSDRPGPIASNQGPQTVAETTTQDRQSFDLLFVPGGMGTRREIDNLALIDWIRQTSESATYTLSVCTGSALLARAGILDGKKATTNKAAFGWVADQGPNVVWQKQARWVEDGSCFTSSGVSAGMDMTLATIARMHGTELAEKVATWCEYDWHRDPDWDPFAKIHGLV